jgi:hypothetical protein
MDPTIQICTDVQGSCTLNPSAEVLIIAGGNPSHQFITQCSQQFGIVLVCDVVPRSSGSNIHYLNDGIFFYRGIVIIGARTQAFLNEQIDIYSDYRTVVVSNLCLVGEPNVWVHYGTSNHNRKGNNFTTVISNPPGHKFSSQLVLS